MNLLQRLYITTVSRFEGAVSSMENHDAAIDAALKETRHALAKAHTQLTHVKKDGNALQQRASDLEKQAALWQQRAASLKNTDKDKALQCLQRRHQCLDQLTASQEALQQHEPMQRQLQQHISAMEDRLRTMLQQQRSMRARQSTAEASRILRHIEADHHSHNIDSLFERWETRIAQDSYDPEQAGTDVTHDSFAQSFDDAEQYEALCDELDALDMTLKGGE